MIVNFHVARRHKLRVVSAVAILAFRDQAISHAERQCLHINTATPHSHISYRDLQELCRAIDFLGAAPPSLTNFVLHDTSPAIAPGYRCEVILEMYTCLRIDVILLASIAKSASAC